MTWLCSSQSVEFDAAVSEQEVTACLSRFLGQCFSTAGPRPGTGPWHQLYRAARGRRKLQYATRFH